MTVIKTCWKYFPDHKGKITGLIVSCYGLSSTLYNLFATIYINPDGIPANLNINGEYFYEPCVTKNVKPYLLRFLTSY
jgi:hypothetical protein